MSIAYLDPGNIESDLQAGTIARYHLLWILIWSTIFGLVVQRLAARIGTVTGLHLAELCHRRFPMAPRLLLWIMTEIAIIGSDMQEVIGTAISINLLSSGRIPLYGGVLITICDTFTFLLLDKYGLRKLELFFGSLITVMAVSFGFEFFTVGPEFGPLAQGSVIPWCSNCRPEALGQAVGIIGAIIMPHNLYLHSALVKSRKIDRSKKKEVGDANRYVFIESAMALGISLIINVMVTAVFAHGLFNKKNSDIRQTCGEFINSSSILNPSMFPNDDELVDADLQKAGIFLGCAFGIPALYIWAIGIFAAGQSSTMTGTYAGQFVMEGFLNLRWARWSRVLLTRMIAIAPTLIIAIFYDIGNLTGMNDTLNALMSLMLPFALLPTLIFSSSERVMGEFRNGVANKIVVSLLSIVVITINLYFVVSFVENHFSNDWWVYAVLGIFFFYYVAFVLYLVSCFNCSNVSWSCNEIGFFQTGCFLAVLGFDWVLSVPLVGPHFAENSAMDVQNLIAQEYRNINSARSSPEPEPGQNNFNSRALIDT